MVTRDAEYVTDIEVLQRLALIAPPVVAKGLARWLERLRRGDELGDAEWVGLKALIDTASAHESAMRLAAYWPEQDDEVFIWLRHCHGGWESRALKRKELTHEYECTGRA
jgi:hypothetical protein